MRFCSAIPSIDRFSIESFSVYAHRAGSAWLSGALMKKNRKRNRDALFPPPRTVHEIIITIVVPWRFECNGGRGETIRSDASTYSCTVVSSFVIIVIILAFGKCQTD